VPRVAEPRTACRRRAGVRVAARAASVAAAGVLLCLAAAPGRAQPASSAIDAGVADLDPHATSLRRIEPGLGRFDFNARLRPVDHAARWGVGAGVHDADPVRAPRPAAPQTAWRDPATGLLHHQPRRYRAPGVRALLDRPLYLARRGADGRIDPDAPRVAIIGANTVFELTPERAPEAPRPAGPPPAGLVDTRLDLRVGGIDDTRGVAQRMRAVGPTRAEPRRVRNGPASGDPAAEPVPVQRAGDASGADPDAPDGGPDTGSESQAGKGVAPAAARTGG